MGNTIIDISKNDTITNWNKLKKECPFIIFRGTRGSNDISPTMKTYINACESHKVPYFIYAYMNLGNEAKQAKYLVDQTKDLIGVNFVGYVIDAEESNPSSAILKAIKAVKKYAPTAKIMLYTMYSQYKVVKEAVVNRGDDVVWWEARYGKDTGEYDSKYKCHSDVDLHQFTTMGKVDFADGTVDMSKIVSDVPLSWFTTPTNKSIPAEKKGYTGDTNIIFPKRGYYKLGDGYTTYAGLKDEIKKVQKAINWMMGEILGPKLVVDGEYGKKTRAAVEDVQLYLSVTCDGYFGPVTLKAITEHSR